MNKANKKEYGFQDYDHDLYLLLTFISVINLYFFKMSLVIDLSLSLSAQRQI